MRKQKIIIVIMLTIVLGVYANQDSSKVKEWENPIKDYEKEWQFFIDMGLSIKDIRTSGSLPLKSYIYPDKSGLTEEEMKQHFKQYNAYFKKKYGYKSLKSSYYNQRDKADMEQKVKNRKNDNELSEYVMHKQIILLAELNEDLGWKFLSGNPPKSIASKKYYHKSYKVTKVLKDIHNFYKVGDIITCCDYTERYFSQQVLDWFPPVLKKGDEVLLTMKDKTRYDMDVFINAPMDEDDRYFGPKLYYTRFEPRYISKKGKILFHYFTLNDLLEYMEKYNKTKKQNFYNMEFK